MLRLKDSIIKIQSLFKGINIRNKIRNRGPGFINKRLCNNEDKICIGSEGKYIACCRDCYFT